MRIAHPCRALVAGANALLPSPCRYASLPRFLTGPSVLRHRPHAPFQLRSRSMATAEGPSPVVTSAEEDAKFGFRRPEMYRSSLSSTVDAYDRHVFVCFKGPDAWAPRVEDSDTAVLPKLLSSAVKARKNDIDIKTKLTVCGGCEGGIGFSDGDVLIFPDMIKYMGLLESDVDGFVDDVFVNGRPWASGVPEVLVGCHIFVCAHGSRDRRCGVCGPALIQKLNEEIELRGLKDQVFVSPCSHIGGHKYAGNLIIYSPDQEGKITGHWYGYVTPSDLPDLLDQHVTKGLVIERLWRGQMGTSFQKGEMAKKQNLPNGKNEMESEKPQAVSADALKDSSFTCCQEANGFSRCTDQSSSRNDGKKPKEEEGK